MKILPYGSWPSPIAAERIASGALRLAQPRLDRGRLYWLESRPHEGGRQVVVCEGSDATPASESVRTRVHEYGGGDYAVRDGVLFYSRLDDQRVYRLEGAGGAPRPLTEAGARHADFEVSPDGRWLVAVEERPRAGGEPENRIVAIPAAGGPPLRVWGESDFASSPRFSPDGRRLAFTSWDHPNMPWDGTRLRMLDWGPDGPAGAPRELAGGDAESIFQPGFSPAGDPTFVSDRSGWWNLHQHRDGGIVPLCPIAAELGRPQWVFALSTWAFVDAQAALCVHAREGRERLARLELATGRLTELELPYTSYEGLRVEGRRACFVGASPTRAPAVCSLDLRDGAVREHRSSLAFEPDEACLSAPEAFGFRSDGETARALVYRPVGAGCAGPPAERPPLLVMSHGGPTSAARSELDLRVQFWTSRGFAVVDVDYRGSSGYGRAYRERLRGGWGVVDVADCIAAARFLAGQGLADPRRMCIRGGSAGGYTTLCALTFHDVFSAGASHFGIGDLEALVRDTHKFESRYLDGLVGPYPERRDLYRARSPIHFTERLSCPVIFFQGLEDRVVPPSQAEAMVAALAARGILHAYVAFPGEQHGFRRAENVRAALEGELYFYGRALGFETDAAGEGVELRSRGRAV